MAMDGRGMRAVRYGVPATLALIGLVIVAIDHSSTGVEGWGMFTGAALAVLLLNVLYRIGARGDVDRGEEESARAYFDAHGDWPATAAATGRKWRLPAGVVTLEAETAAAARRTGAPGGPSESPEGSTAVGDAETGPTSDGTEVADAASRDPSAGGPGYQR
jgi:hypothetical protein